MRMLRRLGTALLPGVFAVVIALTISSLVMAALGVNPFDVFSVMLDFGDTPQQQVTAMIVVLNRAVPLFLSGLAVAIAFRMGLFNIGVEGQYRLAAIVAAAAGAAVALPAVLHVVLIMVVAMVVGALWAAIVAVLKVTRGVSEVISSIMLNFVALGLTSYLLTGPFRGTEAGAQIVGTATIPESGWVPSLNGVLGAIGLSNPPRQLYGFLVIALVVGIVVGVLLNRTRFGFDLKASGMSPSAASASGVNARAMVVKTMLLSGAVAGLIGLPDVLGQAHAYTSTFTSNLGFLGIAVALLGRNRPLGIAFAALLFAFLDRSLVPLQINDYPSSVVRIVQGTIVLAVVVANEIARRVARRSAERGTAMPGAIPGDGGTGVGQSLDGEGVVSGTGAGVSRTTGAGQADVDGRGSQA
jgi:ABC-type uncharacterized transport system permease subunit